MYCKCQDLHGNGFLYLGLFPGSPPPPPPHIKVLRATNIGGGLGLRLLCISMNISTVPSLSVSLSLSRWLKQEYEIPFPLQKQPPSHMPIAYGLVDIRRAREAEPDEKGGGAQGATIEEEEEESQNEGGPQKQTQTTCCLCFKVICCN